MTEIVDTLLIQSLDTLLLMRLVILSVQTEINESNIIMFE